MTALATDRDPDFSAGVGRVIGAKVKASTTVYGGGFVSRLTSTGLVQPAGDTASTTFAGVAMKRVTGNAAGTTIVEVRQQGVVTAAFSGTCNESDVGATVYLVDDQTVALAATTTNDIACGKIVERISATSVRVAIDGYAF